ncbi:hypothetical protein Aduo_010819 [Ancylostoma duodenale]
MCSAGVVQAVGTGSVLPSPGFVALMATITPSAPNAMGCIGLTITCPPGVGNLMLFNLGIPALAIPIAEGIIASLTCGADGNWRTPNLPVIQLGMPITRVWCLTPLGVLPPGIPGLPGIRPPDMPGIPGVMMPGMPGIRTPGLAPPG